MAREKKSEAHSARFGGPISGRLPLDYGVQHEALKMDMSKAREQSKEYAAGCPHPKGNQNEGRAGRQVLGSEELGVKETHFNRERARAHEMRGHGGTKREYREGDNYNNADAM